MVPLFGKAGLAEAAEAMALMIGYGGLFLVGLAAAVGLFARSRVASVIALALVFILTLLAMPWEAFRPFQSDDPDVHHWMAAWRTFACWWGFTLAVAVGAAIRSFCFPAKATAGQEVAAAGRVSGQGIYGKQTC